MSSILETYLPAIIPLILTAIAAWINFHFDTQTENERNKKKRASLIFLCSGILGTAAAFWLVVVQQKQSDATGDALKEANMHLVDATNQLTGLAGQTVQLKNQIGEANMHLVDATDQLTDLASQNAQLKNQITQTQTNIESVVGKGIDRILQQTGKAGTIDCAVILSDMLDSFQQTLAVLEAAATAKDQAAIKALKAKIDEANQRFPPVVKQPGTNTVPAFPPHVRTNLILPPFVRTNDYVYQPIETGISNGGRWIYNFTITNAGDYIIQALVDAPNANENSLYVNIDAEPKDPEMIWDIPITSGFEKRVVLWRGDDKPDDKQLGRTPFPLTVGDHQLIIIGKSANVKVKTPTLVELPQPPQGLRAFQ